MLSYMYFTVVTMGLKPGFTPAHLSNTAQTNRQFQIQNSTTVGG
jgi:hypothetical protein